MIYFIQENEAPFRIKIGYSASPEKRIATLAAMLPQGVHILKVVEGEAVDESWLHETFRQYRVEGKREWYFPALELIDYIDSSLTVFPTL